MITPNVNAVATAQVKSTECERNPLPAVFNDRKDQMARPRSTWRKVMAQPGHFTLQVLKAFQKNQGLLLSGALAYYILLSVIPLFTFLLLMLSHVIDEAALLATLRRYIGLIIPGNSAAVLAQVRNILEHREVASWVVLIRDAVLQLACVQRA